MKSFEIHGLWWLPEHDDHKVPGVLSWNPSRGGALKLVGQLWAVRLLDNDLPNGDVQKYRDRSHDLDKTYPLIHGQSEQTAFTLINNFQKSKREWSLEQSSETVHVNALLEGAFFETPDMQVDRARIGMRDLAEWMDISGLKVTYPSSEGVGDQFAVVAASRMPDVMIPFEGAKVRIGHSLAGTREGNVSAGIEQDWSLLIERDRVEPMQSFVDIASDFQDLISIATGRTAEFREVVFHHPEVPLVSVGGTRIRKLRRDLTYHAQWSNRIEDDSDGDQPRKSLSTFEMYFTFDQLGADGLGRWLETALQFKTELARAMSTRHTRGYLEDRIMNVCAALESFDKHRRGVDEEWYVRRVSECIDLAGDVFRDLIVDAPDAWAERVRDLRNDLAHHRDRFRLDGTVGGYLVAEQLFWLFALCVLRAARAPDAVFDSITKNRNWSWMREQAVDTGDKQLG